MGSHESRVLQLDGAANFRDLGGLPTSDGGSVRRGRIFRSDALYRLTENDTAVLNPLGIRTVIDLRSPDEVNHYPESPLKSAGLRHVNVPIASETYSVTGSMIEDYLILLHNAHEGFRTIFGYLASDPYPLVINCFAGKDRTGLTSALILGALGVPDNEIVTDYALSEQHMLRHMHIHGTVEDISADVGTLPAWLAATPATMEATLDAISEEWGSVPGYLDAIGIPIEELRQISDALVERSSEVQDGQ